MISNRSSTKLKFGINLKMLYNFSYCLVFLIIVSSRRPLDLQLELFA